MATSTGRNIIKDITKYSGTDYEINYQLQIRLSTYNQNNPSSVLKQSQEFSNETDFNGNKVPLGGKLNEFINNNNNAPSQNKNTKALYSDEFPFWDFNCKGKINNKVTEVTENEEIEEFGNEEIEEFGNEEIKEEFGNEEIKEEPKNWGIIIAIIAIIIIIIILVLVLNSGNTDGFFLGDFLGTIFG